MARKVEVQLTDDLDGSHATETVRFGIDDRSYEIDLPSKHVAELRNALDKYIGVAQRVSSGCGSQGNSRTLSLAATDAEQNTAIRA